MRNPLLNFKFVINLGFPITNTTNANAARSGVVRPKKLVMPQLDRLPLPNALNASIIYTKG